MTTPKNTILEAKTHQSIPESRVSGATTPTKNKRGRGLGRPFSKNNPGRPRYSRNWDSILDEALGKAGDTRQRLLEPCQCVGSILLVPPAGMDETVYQRWLWDRSCRTIDEHYARMAFKDKDILRAFQNKRIPDLQAPKATEDDTERLAKRIAFVVNVNGHATAIHPAP